MALRQVQAKYEYEYMSGNGIPAKMLPGDLFTLLRKSNSDWWYVKREGELKPVYIPATYLEVPPDNALLGQGNLTSQRTGMIPYAHIEIFAERSHPVPSNTVTSQMRHNLVSEMSDRLRHQVNIPKPDYEESTQRLRPTQLNVKDVNGRPGFPKAPTPVGGAMSPMTDSEPSSHSEQSSVNSPDFFPSAPHESQPHSSHLSNSNIKTTNKMVPSSQLAPSSTDEWETHRDERGRRYYYNPSTNETSWDPTSSFMAMKERSSSVSPKTNKKSDPLVQPLPPGWREEKTASGGDVFINDKFKEKWYKSYNEQGETYYYSGDREETGWHLPTEPSSIRRRKSEESQSVESTEIRWRSKVRGNSERTSKTQSVFLPSESRFLMNVHRRHSEIEQGDIHPETASNEREGYLQRARPGEATRKVKWQTVYTAMSGSALAFYKDLKLKSGTPEMMLELWGAQVVLHSEKQSKYLKKSYIELKTPLDKEYWLQSDTEEETHLWYTAIYGAVRSMPPASQRPLRRQNSSDDAYSPSSDDLSIRPPSPRSHQRRTSPRPRPENLIEIGKSRADKKKIKNKLKSFITKRPTLESLQKQGIMREEDVFGRHIQTLCHQQGTVVPRFLTDCITLIEKSGLHVDGIYRVNGNLSLIQKLRFLVDQEKPVDFNSSPWKEDIHVIAGALKLFLRELPEPLVTFNGYDGFMEAMKKPDRKTKLRAFQEVVSSLPRVNQETMKALFRHLNRVVDYKDKNRMLPQNLAIVFGPTLMWPKKESFNVALSMVCQNQCIEFIINEHLQLFK